MLDDETVVRTTWSGLGGERATADAVLEAHRQPHRRYHTVAHVAAVVRWIDRLAAEVPVPHLAVVQLAGLFHDVVYEPRAADNEARSAELASEAAISLGWSRAEADQAARLVMATAGHDVQPGDTAATVLLDADLAVLGASADEYAAYVAGVRFEYAHVSDQDWRVGRAAVMQTFLDRPSIYTTDVMRQDREVQAQTNVAAEIHALRQP